MWNDPEWASKEEWDAYAWFGFAISEAQYIERLLLIIATAIQIYDNKMNLNDKWDSIYNSYGNLTLGTLINKIKPVYIFPDYLSELIEDARQKRNYLAHEIFWPHKNNNDDLSLKNVEEKFRSYASSFRHTSNALENIVQEVLLKLHIDKESVVEKLVEELSK